MNQTNSSSIPRSSDHTPGPQKEAEKKMAFLDHTDELRVRLMRCLYVFAAGFLLAYFWTNTWVMEFLRAPLFAILPETERKLYFTSLFENFMTHLKIAGYTSLLVGFPFFFFQLWRFVSPGLYEKERRLVLPFVGAGTVFFFAGAAFAYWVLFPVGFKFFVQYGMPGDTPLLTIDAYYGTCLKLMLLFGAAFELPVLVVLLGVMGLVDAPTLRKFRKTAILGITVASALFAPPDAISMLILMIPLILMYEGAIWVVQIIGAKRRKVAESENRDGNDEMGDNPLMGRSRP